MNTNQLHQLQYLFTQINIRNLLFIYFFSVGPISGFHMNVPFLMLIACSETWRQSQFVHQMAMLVCCFNYTPEQLLLSTALQKETTTKTAQKADCESANHKYTDCEPANHKYADWISSAHMPNSKSANCKNLLTHKPVCESHSKYAWLWLFQA